MTEEELMAAFEKQLAEPALIVTSAKDATKPLMHIVLLKWKIGTPQADVDPLLKAFKDMQYQIPGLFFYLFSACNFVLSCVFVV